MSDDCEAELAAYHKFHEAISGKVGFLRAGWGDAKEHADAISEAFRALHEERVEIARRATPGSLREGDVSDKMSSDQRETAVPPYARAAALMGRRVTTRSFRMECASCAGSGYSGYVLNVATSAASPDRLCRGCNGDGYVYVTETTVG